MAPPVVLIVAGIIVFAVAFLGCYGAMRESYYMLMAVSGFLSFTTKSVINAFAVCFLSSGYSYHRACSRNCSRSVQK